MKKPGRDMEGKTWVGKAIKKKDYDEDRDLFIYFWNLGRKAPRNLSLIRFEVAEKKDLEEGI